MARCLIAVAAASAAVLFAVCDLDAVIAHLLALSAIFSSSPDALPLLNQQDLSRYDGEVGSQGLYLSVLGQVFDVSKGRRHYGPGGAYHFFAGRDASRAFVTGDFTEGGLTDDLSGLSPSQVVALYDWLSFYQRDYRPVGRLIGRYYSDTGKPTEALRQVEAALARGLELKAEAEADSKRFPSCNSEWSAAGGRVWCSEKSGGVQRPWAGVPRKMFNAGSRSVRCVCVPGGNPELSASAALQEYEGCPPLAESCTVHSF
ncbi:neuferricin [Paramormyrops kingsleyae]|uniref:neuferricin n=1 Tax=Paramormyrops kingsleyae TaxID=1676925 RepID=UPI003B972436